MKVRTIGLLVAFLLLSASSSWAAGIGILAASTGKVLLLRDGKTFSMRPGTPLYLSDEIQSGDDGKARILFNDESVLSVGPRTHLALTGYSMPADGSREFAIKVLGGRFKMAVSKWFLGATKGSIETPTAVAGVRGTVVWGDTELDAVCALEGEIGLTATSSQKARTMKAGDCSTGMKDGKTESLKPAAEDLKKFLAEFAIP